MTSVNADSRKALAQKMQGAGRGDRQAQCGRRTGVTGDDNERQKLITNRRNMLFGVGAGGQRLGCRADHGTRGGKAGRTGHRRAGQRQDAGAPAILRSAPGGHRHAAPGGRDDRVISCAGEDAGRRGAAVQDAFERIAFLMQGGTPPELDDKLPPAGFRDCWGRWSRRTI